MFGYGASLSVRHAVSGRYGATIAAISVARPLWRCRKRRLAPGDCIRRLSQLHCKLGRRLGNSAVSVWRDCGMNL